MLSCKALLQTSNLEWILSSHVFMSPLFFPFVFTYSVKKVISVLQLCSDTRGSLYALAKWGNHSKSGKTGKNNSCFSNNLNCIQKKPKLLLSCVLSPFQLSCYGIYFMVIKQFSWKERNGCNFSTVEVQNRSSRENWPLKFRLSKRSEYGEWKRSHLINKWLQEPEFELVFCKVNMLKKYLSISLPP